MRASQKARLLRCLSESHKTVRKIARRSKVRPDHINCPEAIQHSEEPRALTKLLTEFPRPAEGLLDFRRCKSLYRSKGETECHLTVEFSLVTLRPFGQFENEVDAAPRQSGCLLICKDAMGLFPGAHEVSGGAIEVPGRFKWQRKFRRHLRGLLLTIKAQERLRHR